MYTYISEVPTAFFIIDDARQQVYLKWQYIPTDMYVNVVIYSVNTTTYVGNQY
jgi:hypothetical protein